MFRAAEHLLLVQTHLRQRQALDSKKPAGVRSIWLHRFCHVKGFPGCSTCTAQVALGISSTGGNWKLFRVFSCVCTQGECTCKEFSALSLLLCFHLTSAPVVYSSQGSLAVHFSVD